MKTQKFNWQIWVGFLLSFLASLSYPVIFVRWPLTRDFPWVTILLYLIAAAFLLIGLRRAFAPGRALKSKIAASVVTTLSVLIMGVFLFSILVFARWLPSSAAAPKVGQQAPEFTLTDVNGKSVSLAELISSPLEGQPVPAKPKGVLLIFYRGYW